MIGEMSGVCWRMFTLFFFIGYTVVVWLEWVGRAVGLLVS